MDIICIIIATQNIHIKVQVKKQKYTLLLFVEVNFNKIYRHVQWHQSIFFFGGSEILSLGWRERKLRPKARKQRARDVVLGEGQL